jgi:valyl-tRNA synthetase
MTLSKHYSPGEVERRWMERWREASVYDFDPDSQAPVYSIDTPPPTVSGNLHLGHTYSYSHADFVARFWRMNGYNVYYPMGYDDNGLPTERLVEKRLGIRAAQVGRGVFIEKCLEVSESAEAEYQALWQRLGLSIDWRYTYRTIDENSRRAAQLSFIDLYRMGLAYQQEAPTIWCPECQTAIAQADLEDLERHSEFLTLAFRQENGDITPIATTRPELLPACVAVFVHPDDKRYKVLVGKSLQAPLFGHHVPVLEDPGADPGKGTGAVMCCTFGDTADVTWWRQYKLPLIEAMERDGCLSPTAGKFAGLGMAEARQQIKEDLARNGLILDRQATLQSVRVHERCDTPVEYIVARQWFIKILDHKAELLELGEKVIWRPEHMVSRYRAWVENLNWDWCISRQRFYGVPFPVWYCESCGEVNLADESRLPVDPADMQPGHSCACGSMTFRPEQDVMDTWATSSLTPQIVGRWPPAYKCNDQLYAKVFPFALRPQAHEIIRTWAFYTLLKSHYHFQALPWKEALISGWGIAGDGMGKISKSKGGGPLSPMEMIERYSADAVRYWAASAGPGKDSVISEEKIQMGAKLVTKLWNVARFSERFLEGYISPNSLPVFSPADRWILARLQGLVRRATELMRSYDYAAAKSEMEGFFWRDLADNYLEMCKQRLYDASNPGREAALYTLYQALLTILKLFAPFLPYVTEEIYMRVFAYGSERREDGRSLSIHTSGWPESGTGMEDRQAEAFGETLVAIATAVRRYKSENNLSLGTELASLQVAGATLEDAERLRQADFDLISICRVRQIELIEQLDPKMTSIESVGDLTLAIQA